MISDEDRAVLAAQEMLVTRRRGPGRIIDTSGSFDEFSARMEALRVQNRSGADQADKTHSASVAG